MFGSSSGVPYWHQATASSPSKTRAACALPSRTRRSFQGRPFSPSGLPTREWNHVHQQPPNPMPLCFSARSAKASQVEASSALIEYSLIAPSVLIWRQLTSERVYARPACWGRERRSAFHSTALPIQHFLVAAGWEGRMVGGIDADRESIHGLA